MSAHETPPAALAPCLSCLHVLLQGDKDPFAGLGFDSDGDEEGGGYTQRKFKIVIKPKEV
jgi:hypothetical protein